MLDWVKRGIFGRDLSRVSSRVLGEECELIVVVVCAVLRRERVCVVFSRVCLQYTVFCFAAICVVVEEFD